MTTVLQYLVIAAVIGLLLFGVALLLFGRGERLSALPARTSPAQLPERGIDGTDVRRVRFALALRGYRMSDVDWTLERLADELDRTRAELAGLTGHDADASGPGDGDPAGDIPDGATPPAAGPARAEFEATHVNGRLPTADLTAADMPVVNRVQNPGDPDPGDPVSAHPNPAEPGHAGARHPGPPPTADSTVARNPTHSTATPGSEA